MDSFPGYVTTEVVCERRNRMLIRAVRASDGMAVVLKKLNEDFYDYPNLQKLKREFSIMTVVAGPYVLKAYELAVSSSTAAIVMEDIGGRSLDEVVNGKPMSLGVFLPIAIQLTTALGVVHGANVVHRDVKAGNVIVNLNNPEENRVRLADFGLAGYIQDSYTQSDMEGSLAYMAPEQTKRIHCVVNQRSDLYSLGVTFYQCLVGHLPFTGDSLSIIHGHLARKATPVRVIRPEIPEVISAIVEKLMEKSPDDRYQSAYGVREDLFNCYTQLRSGPGIISTFKLASRDFPCTLQLSTRLYGRECLIDQLVAAFVAVFGSLDEINREIERRSAPALGGSSHHSGHRHNGPSPDGAQDSSAAASQERSPARATSPGPSVLRGAGTLAPSQPARRGVLVIRGVSGIGKTGLVLRFVQDVATELPVIFLRGKYDHNTCASRPYSAIIAAIVGLVQQLLADNERLLAVQPRIIATLGENASVLVDLIPEAKHLLGTGVELAPVPPLPPAETALRLTTTVCQLLESLYPLVVFLDDMQWADTASLKLIRRLATWPSIDCLLICACRSNEVRPSHPMALAIDEIRSSGVPTYDIDVGPLSVEDVNGFLAATLRCQAADSVELARLIHSKTDGNPFFIRSFLNTLYSQEKIKIDYQTGGWHWNVSDIEHMNYTDNVVDMLVSYISQLSPAAQEMLKLASMFGNAFEVPLLAVTAARPQEAIMRSSAVSEAIHKRLIVSVSAETYRFVHDRVQQAAALLVAPEDLPALHLRIGRRLLAARSRDAGAPAGMREARGGNHEDNIFEVVAHYNRGVALIDEFEERCRLAELNLQAGAKASTSTAHEAARSYFEAGVRALYRLPGGSPPGEREPQEGAPPPPEQRPIRHAELRERQGDLDASEASRGLGTRLLLRLAESEYLCQNFRAADEHLSYIEGRAASLREKLDAFRLRVNMLSTANRFKEVVERALAVVREFGIEIERGEDGTVPQARIDEAYAAMWRAWEARGVDANLDEFVAGHPVGNEDDEFTSLLFALVEVMAVMYLSTTFGPYQVLAASVVRLCIERGGNAAAVSWYGYMCFILSGIRKDYEGAVRMRRLCLAVINREGTSDFLRGRVLVCALCTFPVGSNWLAGIPPMAEAARHSQQAGDLNNALYSINQQLWISFFAGVPLGDMYETMVKLKPFVRKCVNLELEVSFDATVAHVHLLQSGQNDVDAMIAGADMGSEMAARGPYCRSAYLSFRFMALVVLGRLREAAALLPSFQTTVVDTPGIIFNFEEPFLQGLAETTCRLGVWPGPDAPAPLEDGERAEAAARAAALLARLEEYATHCADFRCRALFIDAERERALAGPNAPFAALGPLLGRYEAAARAARDSQAPQVSALAHELAASLCLAAGVRGAGLHYLKEAVKDYSAWGARTKVALLLGQHAELRDALVYAKAPKNASTGSGSRSNDNKDKSSSDSSERPARAPAGGVTTGGSGSGSGSGTKTTSGSGAPVSAPRATASTVDILTVVRSALALATESDLDALLSKLMLIIMENAGATVARLVLASSKHCQHEHAPESEGLSSLFCVRVEGEVDTMHLRSEGGREARGSEREGGGESGRRATVDIRCVDKPLVQYRNVSHAIVQYVIRTEEYVLLNNACTEGNFVSCGHVQRNSLRSVLCVPVMHQQKIMGALYLENRFMAGAFTLERVELLQLLAAQLAVSMLNATLHEDLRLYNRELEVKNRSLAMLDRAKDTLLANTSHELRTPCGAIIGLSELLLDSGPLTEQQAQTARIIHQSAEHLLRIINNFLDLSGLESGAVKLERVEFDVASVVNDCVAASSVAAYKNGLEIGSYIDPRCPLRAMGDPTRLKQVIMNLVSNAIKFSANAGPDGHVLISVELVADVRTECVLRFRVEDSGVGIKQEDLPKLFQRFSQVDSSFSRRWEGSGLGLAISKTIVSYCTGQEPESAAEFGAGTISVQSDFGKGSTFYFAVAMAYAPDSRPRAPPALPAPGGPGERPVAAVLARPFVAGLLGRYLAEAGVEAAPCGRPEELAPLLRRIAAEGAPVAFAVVDGSVDGALALLEEGPLAGPGAPPALAELPALAILRTESKFDKGRCPSRVVCLYKPRPAESSSSSDDGFSAEGAGARGGLGRPLSSPTGLGGPAEKRRRTSDILVVEDNPVNQMVVRKLLEQAGHRVEVAEDGFAALEHVRRRPFGLVFMDCSMPRCDGYEATRLIRALDAEQGKHTVIVGLTAHAMAGEREKCLSAGMDEYLSKPVKKEDLLKMVERRATLFDEPFAGPAGPAPVPANPE
eukprot:tig00020684_g12908.t2